MIEYSRENLKQCAISTVIDIWSCIDWEKVDSKRAYGIWDEVTDKIRASAMTTNSYEKCIDKICKKLSVRSLKFRNISDICKESDEIKKGILKLFREEIQFIMLEVRLNNQIRKEQIELEKQRKVVSDDV